MLGCDSAAGGVGMTRVTADKLPVLRPNASTLLHFEMPSVQARNLWRDSLRAILRAAPAFTDAAIAE